MIPPGFAILMQFIKSRSGEPATDDQLMLIAAISPSRVDSASISSGSSPAIEALCGHHPPSSGAPRFVAKVSRTGLARRRPCTAAFTERTQFPTEPRAQFGR
ncbi:hypothetical protein I546_0709 [Mycobacterium kansasii 732]|nr:hypothetical protein I546_0709 [Mycobacterium kansasii 732]